MEYDQIQESSSPKKTPLESEDTNAGRIKRCHQCRKDLPLDDFYFCGGKLKAMCKECHKWFVCRWQRKNPEKVAASKKTYNAKYRASNKSIPSAEDCFGDQYPSALEDIEQETQDTTECCEDDDAQGWLSSTLRRSLIARWLPFTRYDG